jgi:hypothetical protein
MAANKNFIANEIRQAEIHTLTIGGTPAAGDTVFLTINSKKITYTLVTGDTTSTTAAALASAIRLSREGEFSQFSLTVASAVITITANSPGRPITATGSGSLTVGATGGVTITDALVQSNLGPADANDINNWQGGVLPLTTDTLFFDNATFPMLYNLSIMSGFSLAAIYVKPTFSGGGIGLPLFAPEGYREYRGGRLTLTACPILRVELPDAAGAGSFRFDTGSTASTVFILGSGNPGIGQEQVDWIGSSVSSTVEVLNAGVTIATGYGETASVSEINGTGSAISLGSGVSVTTLNVDSCTVDARCNLPTVNMNNGSTLTIRDTATMGTVQLDSGTLTHISSGNITTLYLGSGATADFSQSRDPITITNVDMNEGSVLLDPYKRITFTNAIGLPRTGGQLSGLVTLDLGTNLRIQRSAY